MVYAIIFIFLGTTFATILGAIFAMFTKKLHKETISFLVNFSLGAIFSLIFLDLFHHSMHHAEDYFIDNKFAAIGVVLGVVCLSGLLFYLLHELLHHLTHHHKEDHDDLEPCHDHAHSTEVFNEKSLVYASFIFLIAIFIHNIPEGLALGIGFSEISDNGIPINGIVTSIVLLIHNFIIGFTMCTSFIQAGKSNKFSILMTTVSSLPALALGFTGYFVSSIEINELFKAIMLSISTGSLIYVMIVELLPQAFYEYKSRFTFIYIMIGIIVNALLIFIAHTM